MSNKFSHGEFDRMVDEAMNFEPPKPVNQRDVLNSLLQKARARTPQAKENIPAQ